MSQSLQTRGLRPPWQPGKSAYEGMQPKELRRALTLARKNSVPAMQTIIDCLKDPDPRIRLTAATAILERAWGKPKEQHDFTGLGAGNQIVIVTGVPDADTQPVADETNVVSGETFTIDIDVTEDSAP